MKTHFDVNKAYIENFEYDEEAQVFVFEVTAYNTNHTEIHEIPEDRAFEILSQYLDDEDLLFSSEDGIEERSLYDLIEDGIINNLHVQTMFAENYETVCANYDDFLSFPDKMKSDHFAAVILKVPPHKRNTWHYIVEMHVYRNHIVPDIYPAELREIAIDLKHQYNPLQDDIIDAFYDNGVLTYALMKDDTYKSILIDEETIIVTLGNEITKKGDVIDVNGQVLGRIGQPWEFTYRELCEVVHIYGDI